MLIAKLVIASLAIGYCMCDNAPSVVTQIGRIIGRYKHSFKGEKYEAYDGIPYALPPIGELRFEPPVPIPNNSTNQIIANEFKEECLQYDRERPPTHIYGKEDCLYLNIYTPRRVPDTLYPVIFDIHGGAFQYGKTFENGAHYLIDHQVILVTVHYRLGLFGFLSTQDEVVPGNMGLKDQSLALKWVHDNILSFGGDPKKVTLTGLSAGGASVHYHYLSPMSRGLFHSGISYSGTALDSWTQTERSRDKAFAVAGMVNCTQSDTASMIRCLKGRSAKDLVRLHPNFMPWKLNPFTPFGPVIETSTNQSFIDRSPIDIISSGDAYDVPWVTGVTSEEGLYPVAEFIRDADLKELNDNWENIAPYLLDYNDTIPRAEHANVSRKIRDHYFEGEPIDRTTLRTLIHLVGDRIFAVDAEKAAREQSNANNSPVWFYRYSYRANQSLSDDPANTTEDLGVCHGDDVYMIFPNAFMSPNESAADMAMLDELLRIMTSVAKNGVPENSLGWQRVLPTESSLRYLDIKSAGDLQMASDSNFAQKQFWSSINFDENQPTSKITFTPTDPDKFIKQ